MKKRYYILLAISVLVSAIGYVYAQQRKLKIIKSGQEVVSMLVSEIDYMKVVDNSLETPTNFGGAASEGSITLGWSNVNDAKYYVISRSEDGEIYEQIGTSSTNSFVDNSPLANVNYYRVQAFGEDTESDMSAVCTVKYYWKLTDITMAKDLIDETCKLMHKQYSYGQGWNGEGTIMLYYGEYIGIDCQCPLNTGWANVFNMNYWSDVTSYYNSFCWYYYYSIIFNANILIPQIEQRISEGESSEEWDYILAQALFFRAYSYQQLVQWYSRRWSDKNGTSRGVPLRLEANQKPLKASSLATVYKQVYADLDKSINLFKSCGITRSDYEKWYPNEDCCHAVYSRAAVNRLDWATAEIHASEITNKYQLMGDEEYHKGFYSPNSEWIFGTNNNTLYYYGYHAYVACNANTSTCRNYPYAISKELIEQIPNEDTRKDLYLFPTEEELAAEASGFDRSKEVKSQTSPLFYQRVRKEHSFFSTGASTRKIVYYHCIKIKIPDGASYDGNSYLCMLRAAEMYYDLAEAKLELGDETGARTALEAAVKPYNAGYSASGLSGDNLRQEIRKYRRFDLFQEGRSFSDLKRWGVDHIRHTWAEGGNWAAVFTGTSETGGCFDKTGKNNWTFCYPQIETSINPEVTSLEPLNWR